MCACVLQGDDHAVRLLEVASQGGNFRFIEYYRGHTARVTKVVMSPKNDTFITAAQVGCSSYWCQGCSCVVANHSNSRALITLALRKGQVWHDARNTLWQGPLLSP